MIKFQGHLGNFHKNVLLSYYYFFFVGINQFLELFKVNVLISTKMHVSGSIINLDIFQFLYC